MKRSWRLNERHYGALQGKDKAQTLEEFGHEQFMLWRRSFDVPPPDLADDSEWSQVGDPRYVGIDGDVPRTESLKLVIDRLLPYWESDIAADLTAGRTVLVTAHGNSLRGLVKHLEGISDADIAELNIPTGIPLVYRLNDDLTPCHRVSISTPKRRPQVPPRSRRRARSSERKERAGASPRWHPLWSGEGQTVTWLSASREDQSPVAR